MRKRIVAGNWKMNKLADEAVALLQEIDLLKETKADELIVFPPALYLDSMRSLDKKWIRLGGQNCYFEDAGAFTGEFSAEMLRSVGASYCLVGHSERRQLFGESDAIVSKKFNAILNAGLTPILCCGETLEQRQSGNHMSVVESQIKSVVKPEHSNRFILAYEPVWAIGTGHTATADQAQEMHLFIRELLNNVTGKGADTSILYGGSCKPSNANELFSMPDIDGGLIGGASLQADSFVSIANAWKE